MLLFLSKLVPALIYPVALIGWLILISILFHRRRRLSISLLALAFLILLAAGNRWVAQGLAYSLERRILPPAEIPTADVIVVLGGGSEAPTFPRPGPEINGAGDRLIHAARLYHQGKAARILATGGRSDWFGSAATTPAEDMGELLVLLGVPSENILLEGESRNTAENAAFSRPILQDLSARRILLVTSAMHMPRAFALFSGMGFEVIPAPADYIVSDFEWQGLSHSGIEGYVLAVFPTAGNLNLTTNALKEYLGLLALDWQR